MPFILWIIGGAVALYAVAKVAAGNALAGVTGTDKQLGTGAGSSLTTQELTHDQKVALAKTMLLRWVYGEKDLYEYNTLEVGAPGVSSYDKSAGAMAVILGANMTDGHAVLTNGALNPTQILVPHKPGGELVYAAPATGFAIFLRPLEGNAIFTEAGASLGDQFKPGPGVALPKGNPGEVKMLAPLYAKNAHLALPAPSTTPGGPASAGSLDFGTGLGSGDISKIHAQDLPDGDPVTLIYDDASGGSGAHGGSAGSATGYPLKVAREAYIRFMNGETGAQLANLLSGSSSLVFGKGYLQAAADLHNAAVTLGA